MNTNDYNSQEQPSVIAIAKTDDELRAVELTEHNGTFEVLWTKSSTAGETNWQAFAAECGFSAEPTAQTRFADDGNKIVVIGFDSAGTAFYRFNMPAVEKKEIEAIEKKEAIVVIRWGGGFLSWSLVVGPSEMEMPAATKEEYVLPISQGVYLYHNLR